MTIYSKDGPALHLTLQPVTDTGEYIYIDQYGTTYPDICTDPGYAGLEGVLETGRGDPFWPAAKKHDKAFARAKLGFQDSNTDNLKTFKEFSVDIGTGMLQGAYMLAAGPAYWLIGGVGGLLKQTIGKVLK